MREILFRGIRIDNGEWVYGSPVYIDGYVEMYWFDSEKQEIEHTLVAPETVGQYTGLNDKNGKMIFEGDVIRDTLGRIKAVEFYRGRYYPFIAFPEYYCWSDDECEVLSNIHDNPKYMIEVKRCEQ